MANKFKQALLFMIMAAIIAGCSSKRSASNESPPMSASSYSADLERAQFYLKDENSAETNSSAQTVIAEGGSTTPVAEEFNDASSKPVDLDKVIMQGNILLEATELDSVVENILGLVDGCGGYVANSQMHTVIDRDIEIRRYYMQIKVPSNQFTSSFDSIKNMADLKNASQSQQNVSLQYYNIESRIATKKTEEERLLSLLAQSSEVKDLLELERRLGSVRTELQVYESQLKNISALIAFSAIDININEIKPEQIRTVSDSLPSRIAESFGNSLRIMINILQGVTIFIATISVPVIFITIIFLIFLFAFKRIVKKKA